MLCRWESETQKIEFINPELTPIKVKKEKKGGAGGRRRHSSSAFEFVSLINPKFCVSLFLV